MCSGVPVLCSNIEVLKEVTGKAAMYVDPSAIDEFTEAIFRGIEDEEWRVSAIQAGLQRGSQFSWNTTAAMTHDAYRQIDS